MPVISRDQFRVSVVLYQEGILDRPRGAIRYYCMRANSDRGIRTDSLINSEPSLSCPSSLAIKSRYPQEFWEMYENAKCAPKWMILQFVCRTAQRHVCIKISELRTDCARHVQVGPRIRISDLIQRAKDQGCEFRISTNRLVTPDGFRQIKFLFNPGNRARFDLTDYDGDEFMLASEGSTKSCYGRSLLNNLPTALSARMRREQLSAVNKILLTRLGKAGLYICNPSGAIAT
jgi:hypothetical protein